MRYKFIHLACGFINQLENKNTLMSNYKVLVFPQILPTNVNNLFKLQIKLMNLFNLAVLKLTL